MRLRRRRELLLNNVRRALPRVQDRWILEAALVVKKKEEEDDDCEKSRERDALWSTCSVDKGPRDGAPEVTWLFLALEEAVREGDGDTGPLLRVIRALISCFVAGSRGEITYLPPSFIYIFGYIFGFKY